MNFDLDCKLFSNRKTPPEYDEKVYSDYGGYHMSSVINFLSLNVNNFQANSGIFIGDNNHPGWDTNQKQNTAIDIAGQYNLITTPSVLVSDNDVFDFPVDEDELHGNKDIG